MKPNYQAMWIEEREKRRAYYRLVRQQETRIQALEAHLGTVLGEIAKKSLRSFRDSVTPRLRFTVLARDGFRCTYCGRSVDQGASLEVDHVLPRSEGGKTELGNLRTACRDCNGGKGAMLMSLEQMASRPLRVSLPGHQGRSEPPCSEGPSALGTDEVLRVPPRKRQGET